MHVCHAQHTPGTYTAWRERREWSVMRLFRTRIAVTSTLYCTAMLVKDSQCRQRCWTTKLDGTQLCRSSNTRSQPSLEVPH